MFKKYILPHHLETQTYTHYSSCIIIFILFYVTPFDCILFKNSDGNTKIHNMQFVKLILYHPENECLIWTSMRMCPREHTHTFVSGTIVKRKGYL